MNLKTAVAAINKHGALLVFPMGNAKNPLSLWSCFYPRSEMRWEWDDGGDDRVHKLWFLREQLSSSKKVAYVKWFRGRATVLSFPVFTAMLSFWLAKPDPTEGLSANARRLLQILQSDSPLSTKGLRQLAGFTGKENEAPYQRALKELWSRLLIVGFGEVDEGAFPSLAVGATQVIFEELWQQAKRLKPAAANKILAETLSANSLFLQYHVKLARASLSTLKSKVSLPKHSVVSFEDL